MNKIFKIKSKDGLFSNGTSSPYFSKTGKIYKNIGHVKTHYAGLTPFGRNLYRDLQVEIVEYEVIETPLNSISIHEFEQQILVEKEKKILKKKEQQYLHEIKKHEDEIKKLKKLLEKNE